MVLLLRDEPRWLVHCDWFIWQSIYVTIIRVGLYEVCKVRSVVTFITLLCLQAVCDDRLRSILIFWRGLKGRVFVMGREV